MTKAMTSKCKVSNNALRLLSEAMRGARLHAKDYVTSLNNQSDQFLQHLQDIHVEMNHLLTWNKTIVVGKTLIVIPIVEIVLLILPNPMS